MEFSPEIFAHVLKSRELRAYKGQMLLALINVEKLSRGLRCRETARRKSIANSSILISSAARSAEKQARKRSETFDTFTLAHSRLILFIGHIVFVSVQSCKTGCLSLHEWKVTPINRNSVS